MSEFNFNSQICTDKNQSERLLALGLKKETADMHWRLQPYYNDEGFDCGLEWSCNIGTFLQEDAYELFFDYIPAWSLHRLIELAYGNWKEDIAPIYLGNSYDMLIGRIEFQVKQGKFNKEYLVCKQK